MKIERLGNTKRQKETARLFSVFRGAQLSAGNNEIQFPVWFPIEITYYIEMWNILGAKQFYLTSLRV